MLIIRRKRGIRPDVGLVEIFVPDIVNLPYLDPDAADQLKESGPTN